MDIFDVFSEVYAREKQEDMSLQEYLLGCRDNPSMYASAAERMVAAIGEPELIDTSSDPRLGRICMNRTILHGDIFDKIVEIPDESIDCVITSPPYYSMRDYGVPGQIGLEHTLPLFLNSMDRMMVALRRVLKSTGTVWINLGDTFAGSGKGAGTKPEKAKESYVPVKRPKTRDTIKPKSRMGIPERFYAHCIDAGWIARNHIVWTKTNPMPDSVKDRHTCTWESILFFAKEKKYYFDLDAVRVQPKGQTTPFNIRARHEKAHKQQIKMGGTVSKKELAETNRAGEKKRGHRKTVDAPPKGKNPGDLITADYTDEEILAWLKECRRNPPAREIAPDIWWINPKPFPEAHFATFPIELPKTILRRACPPNGTVLDPFFGAGTTAVAAEQLGLNWVGIELNQEYIDIAQRRLAPFQNARLEVA